MAPIWINVATEDHERVATVRGFLEILVAQLAARAARAQQIPDERRRELLTAAQPTEHLGSIDTRTAGELGGSYWLLTAKLAREVTRTLPLGETYRATEDVRQAAREVLAVLAADAKVPVLVCDDTDRLLNVATSSERREMLFRGFFGDVLRDIAEHLDCAVVVAAHESYLSHDDYDDLTAGLIEHVPIPPLTERGQLGQIITARVGFVDGTASAEDLLADDAIDLLLTLHHDEHSRSIRKTLTVLRAALALAAGEGAESVSREYVEAAAAS